MDDAIAIAENRKINKENGIGIFDRDVGPKLTEEERQNLPPEDCGGKMREYAVLEAARERELSAQRTAREAEQESRLAALPRPIESLPMQRQQDLRDSLTAAFSGRLDGMPAIAMAAALTPDLHDVQGVPSLRVMHPANAFDGDPTVNERTEYLATRAEFLPTHEAVALLLSDASPAKEIDRRRARFAEVQRRHDLEQAKIQRQRTQRQALREAMAWRREAYSNARNERAIIELAERVRVDGDMAKRLKDPAALLIELARALYTAPQKTDVDPGPLAVDVLDMAPLPEIEK